MQVGVAVQYRVLVDGAYDAYYRLTDPRNQIQSYVFDVVRSTVPRMDLDEAFVSKDEVGGAVLAQLRDVMKDYGYEIKNTLVTDLSPDNRVKASMNEINASRRLKEGALLTLVAIVIAIFIAIVNESCLNVEYTHAHDDNIESKTCTLTHIMHPFPSSFRFVSLLPN